MTYSRKKALNIYERIDSWDMRRVAIIFFVVSLIVRTLLGGFMKHAETYLDEWIYLQQAYGLVNGFGISTVYGFPFSYERWLYSVFLAPACLIGDMRLRFYAISFINSLLMNIGLIPVYLMAKEFLKKNTHILAVLVLFVTMPYMNLSISFMTDVLFYPLALFAILVDFRLLKWRLLSMKSRILYLVSWVVLVGLLIMTKRAGGLFLAMIVPVVVYIIWDYIHAAIGRRKLGGADGTSEPSAAAEASVSANDHRLLKRIILIVVGVVLLLLALVFMVTVMRRVNIMPQIMNYIRRFSATAADRLYKKVWAFYILDIFLALGILPLLILVFSWRRLDGYGRGRLLTLTFLLFISLVPTTLTTYGSYFNGTSITRAMFRYIFFVFMPFLLLFLEAYEKRTAEMASAGEGKAAAGSSEAPAKAAEAAGNRRVFLVLCVVFSLLIVGAVVLFYHGAELGSVTDHGLLYLAMQFGCPARPAACMVLLVFVLLSLLILIKWPKHYLLFFMIVWVATQAYNNCASYQIYLRDYATPADDDIFELRDFVYAHRDETFLIVDTVIPADQPLRRSDTYLDTPNILHTSLDGLNILFAAEDSVDLTRTEIPGGFTFYRPGQYFLYDATEVDYLLLSNTVLAAPGETYELLDVGEGDWYRLYALEDPATLGYIATFDHPSPGTYTFLPQAFSTQYGQDYISGEEPAYLLYGPFGELDPGHYTFTIEYEYTGDALPGERVGSADVVCTELGMAAGPVPVEVGESSVTVEADYAEAVTNFELHLYAQSPGIHVLSVTMVYDG